MKIQVVTISVSSLEKSKKFYEDVLGFTPDAYYEPTRWQSYVCEGRARFGISEVPNLVRTETSDILNFEVDDVDALWQRVKGRVEVESELKETPWGTYKFVIKDPDGFRLGFLGKAKAGR